MARQNREVTLEVNKGECVGIRVRGYGIYRDTERSIVTDDGAILELDYDDNGCLRLMIWADVNDQSPTDIIPLEGARTATPTAD